MNDEDKKLKPGLYIISLPIGNSKDITIRAIEYLQSVDEIYCEDTRVTNKILSIYKIKKSLKNYHDHNGKKVRPEIIKKIKDGKTIALVSDAGTPLISDPGYKLVSELKAKDLYVTAAPGASSPITALTLSGLPTNSFYFLGFLPVKDQSRKNFN
ncbi:MAG: ribosomal RNA small subunit methyltransferase I [Alphaproteobacteria bacterium]